MNKYKLYQKVRIKSDENINKILDQEHKSNGIVFMKQMFNYCGQEYKISKIVKNIYMNKMIKPVAPLYILEGLRCDGTSELLNQICDRTCNLIWHESWLEEA